MTSGSLAMQNKQANKQTLGDQPVDVINLFATPVLVYFSV